MVTAAPRVDSDGIRARVTSEVSGRAPLWFSVDQQHAALLGDRADHVLIGLLMPAMKEGRDLHVGGTVTDQSLAAIRTDTILGEPPGRSGFYLCCGFMGHGFMMAPVIGKYYAEWLTGGAPHEIFARCRLDRFEKGGMEKEDFIIG